MTMSDYFTSLQNSITESYAVADSARKVGLDPERKVEVPQANSLAEKVVGLISAIYPTVSDPRIVQRILDLEKEFGSLDPAVALSIATEVAQGKFCSFEKQHLGIEIGIRLAIAYMTLGVVSSPIEGFTQLKINKTNNGLDYFVPFYAGPIRSAGGTEAAFSLVIVDHLREIFGYARYDPTEDEVRRGVHECYEYHERINNLQYLPSEEELHFLFKSVPVQISGDPSEEREVYNYKDLPRIETNFIRSGLALTSCEGLAQKAPKILKRITNLRAKGFKLSDWDWLTEFVAIQKKIKEGKGALKSSGGATYMQDIVAGRPIFAHPSRSGAFRLRYGRCRNTGYSALGLHPATMAVSKDFIAVGTQLKIEKPTKGCTVASCNTIDGPIVKLKDGSVVLVHTYKEGKLLISKMAEIIYLGDILVPFGDFSNRNQLLGTAGYVEQYWVEEALELGLSLPKECSFIDAVKFSKTINLSLHPRYIYYWSQVTHDEVISILDWVAHGELIDKKLRLPFNKLEIERFTIAKRGLEIVGCPHQVTIEHVILSENDSSALLYNLGITPNSEDIGKEVDRLSDKIIKKENGLETINLLCPSRIRDKAGTFIGARMGRPEKAKLRKLTGSPHVLFPVGEEGGRLRSIQAAVDAGTVNSDFPSYFCNLCNMDSPFTRCYKCQSNCTEQKYCTTCNKLYPVEGCIEHPEKNKPYHMRRADIKEMFELAKKSIGARIDDIPVVVKGVRGTMSQDHSCEHIAKGLLRAQRNLHVNKDGTVRYDISEMPLTHFKAKEIGTSIQKLIELGYNYDIEGNLLENDNQVLEILPHDVVLPACPETPDEKADDVFFNICQFVDDELEFLYKLPRFFKYKSKEDLPGTLLGCMAPHNCAAVVGRIIGFSKIQALLASPYMHAAMRRDCDGDEAAVMLLMDMLVNFSKHFLPSHRGGTQDAPLVLNTRMRAGEVDDMIFDLDVTKKIPLALYKLAEDHKSPSEIKMERVANRLGGEHEFDGLWCSYDTDDINEGPLCSSYKTLPTMGDKVESQMDLCMKIRAVDPSDVARLVIERHFIRDIRGNLRKFSQQVFRCVGCNGKFRRPPLMGKCTKCGGKLIFTISEGSVIKYMQAALNLARTYKVSPYLLQNLEIVEQDINSVFGKEKEKQEALKKWF